jgi:hypothetical protein
MDKSFGLWISFMEEDEEEEEEEDETTRPFCGGGGGGGLGREARKVICHESSFFVRVMARCFSVYSRPLSDPIG